MRFVTVATGVVPLRQYIDAVRAAKANPESQFDCGFTCWWPCSGFEAFGQFLAGMHDRINQAIPWTLRGRGSVRVATPGGKHCKDYQASLRRDQRRLVDIANRIRVYQFETDEVRHRFGHLLARYDD